MYMPKLIDATGTLLPNPWVLMPRDATLESMLATDATYLLVNGQTWVEHQQALQQGGKQLAPWLDSDQTATMLGTDLSRLPLVALNFPGFMDGRSYSTAVILRQQSGFKGEIRAIGDVLRDQLFLMKRCGFSTFDLKDSVKLEDAKSAFGDFHTSYQSTVEEPQPLFRRRA
jgi:uncharacterized protein (DUF934 family)